MHHSLLNLAAVSLCATSLVSADFLGPRYVQPVDLSSDKSAVSAAWKNATASLEKTLKSANSTLGIQNVTFSLGLFSLNDPSASKLQFHYTSPEIAASTGTKKVDGDSIYKVASITKVFTVLAGLLNLKPTDWDRSVADIFPTLGDYAKKNANDPISTIQWNEVTLNNLASHQAGLPASPLISDLAVTLALTGQDPTLGGFPLVNLSSPRLVDALPALAKFLEEGTFNNDNFIPTIKALLPNFEPWTQPVYSNNGFILLTTALANVTGKPLSTLSKESILDPLQLKSSFYKVPESLSPRSVIVSRDEWLASAGIAEGSGGLSSSVNDLAKFGVSVLNSTLLPKSQTRRWLKPVSHTGRFQYSMGRPWEIIRYTHPSGSVTDMYTKAGDSGNYSSELVIIPEYNAGFTILGAASITTRNSVVAALADLLTNTLIPAFESQAKAETTQNFAGTYTSSVQGVNSSVVLAVNQTAGAAPGLLIKSFVSNGTEFKHPLYYTPGARLVPSILSDKTGKVAFRVANANDAPAIDKSKALFSGVARADFLVGDAGSYGGAAFSQWVFQTKNGKATELSPTFLDITLKRS